MLLTVGLTPASAQTSVAKVVPDIFIPCNLPVPSPSKQVPTGCYATYANANSWTLAKTFSTTQPASLTTISVFGQCGGNILSADCFASSSLQLQVWLTDARGTPLLRLSQDSMPVNTWPAFNTRPCGNWESCGVSKSVTLSRPLLLLPALHYALELTSLAPARPRTLTPNIGGVPIGITYTYQMLH